MVYLVDSGELCRETKLLMENNFGRNVTRENFDELFNLAKEQMLESISETIDENKDEVLKDFEEEFKEQEEE